MRALPIVLLLLLGTSATSRCATLHVPSDYPAIQDAVDASHAGDEILVAPGTYVEHVQLFGIGPLTVQSESGPALTTVNGGGSGPCFIVTMCTGITIRGFTITGGNSLTSGGGIIIDRCTSVLIDGNVITGNGSRYEGGGIWSESSVSVTITDNVISYNASLGTFDGGGVYLFGVSADILNNRFEGNSALAGC
jgi:nitrous oxidase accessory protein NosD